MAVDRAMQDNDRRRDFTSIRKQLMRKTPAPIDESEPRFVQRADVAPTDGFSLVVDGHFKARYDDQTTAQNAGAELLGRFPMLQILIYDAATRIKSPLQ